MDREWELRAACLAVDPEVFFRRKDIAEAKWICAGCPVQSACLDAALAREADLPQGARKGIVAGLNGPQRRAEQARRDATAPPPPPSPKPKKVTPAEAHLEPCGTRAAYQRHVRRKEPIDDACRAANTRDGRAYRSGKSKVLADH
ncbi:WhiB family transcriptional regulator [Streptomyces sp. NPDC055210]